MAREYKIGDRYYLPVVVSDVVNTFIRMTYLDGVNNNPLMINDRPDLLLTAEEIADGLDLIARATLEEYTEKATKRIQLLEKENTMHRETIRNRDKEIARLEADRDEWKKVAANNAAFYNEANKTASEAAEANDELKAKVSKLKQQLADANELLADAQAQVKELTEADCMRVQEFKPIIEERDRLKSELEQEKKRTQVWKDSAEEHRQTAEELEGDVKRYEQDISEKEVTIQKLTKENDSLKADILELKAQLNVFRPDPKEIEALKKRIAMLEKLKLAHIRTIQGLTRQIKGKNFMISALVKKGIELEEGGDTNGQ